jgi:hypothetical protein
MEVRYNVSGDRRKEMVKVVSEALEGWEIKYLGAPSFSYQVGDFEITKDGTLVFSDSTDSKMVEDVLEGLEQSGFECESHEDLPEEKQATEEQETDSLSISMPRESFMDEALENLDHLLESKGNLIKKAFGIEEATYTLTESDITFAWLNGEVTPEKAKATQDFISKLCEMARTQKRVTAKAKAVDNEKYAFRCFLLRLGLIGAEYKATRKILMANLSGNASFKSGKKKEVAEHEQE